MEHPSLNLINRFFETYGQHDRKGIQSVLANNIRWVSLGRHPYAGIKNGIDEVLAFFDTMGTVMGCSNNKVEKLIVSANDRYVVECQHVWTDRQDAVNLDHLVCVLWTFENGKIIEGRHFFSDPGASDSFFNYLAGLNNPTN